MPPPPPWLDPSAYVDAALYFLIRLGTDVLFVINAVGIGTSWVVASLRVVVVNLAADGIGNIFRTLTPVYMLAVVGVIFMVAATIFARYLTQYRVSSLEKVMFVTGMAAVLSVTGAEVIKDYDLARTTIGKAFYTFGLAMANSNNNDPGVTAFKSLLQSGGGQSVSVRCDLIDLAGQPPDCAGYDMAMSFLFYSNSSEIFGQTTPYGFQVQFFSLSDANGGAPIDPSAVPALSADQRNRLLGKAYYAPLRALMGIPISAMALLEQIGWFLLSLATIFIFISLAIQLIFAVFTPFGSQASQLINQLVQLVRTTALMGIYMGLMTGLMLLAQGNLIFFLAFGVLGGGVYFGLLWQIGPLMLKSFDAALGDVFQSGLSAAGSVAGSAVGAVTTAATGGANLLAGATRPVGQLAGGVAQGALRELGVPNQLNLNTLGQNLGAVAVLGAGQSGKLSEAHQAVESMNAAPFPEWRKTQKRQSLYTQVARGTKDGAGATNTSGASPASPAIAAGNGGDANAWRSQPARPFTGDEELPTICPSCGNIVPDGLLKCESCGATVPPSPIFRSSRNLKSRKAGHSSASPQRVAAPPSPAARLNPPAPSSPSPTVQAQPPVKQLAGTSPLRPNKESKVSK